MSGSLGSHSSGNLEQYGCNGRSQVHNNYDDDAHDDERECCNRDGCNGHQMVRHQAGPAHRIEATCVKDTESIGDSNIISSNRCRRRFSSSASETDTHVDEVAGILLLFLSLYC